MATPAGDAHPLQDQHVRHQLSSSKRPAMRASSGPHALGLVHAVTAYDQLAALAGGEEQHAQDAFRVDLLAVLRHHHPALEASRGVDQLGRRAGVQPEAVDDLRLLLNHG
jgi:hypothetical protein